MDSSTESTPFSLPNQTNGTIHHTNDDDPVNTNSNHSLAISSPPRSTKGYGLRKWRRYPRNNPVSPKEIHDNDNDNDRDKGRDSDSDSTAGRMLKRGSSNIIAPINDDDNNNNNNDNNNPLSSINDSSTAIFNAGIDSEGSSRSSTAASAPKHHHLRDKNKVKNSNSNQRVVLNRKSQIDPSKKAEFEKENSPISSFDSDSRSCNSVFGVVDRTSNVVGGSGGQQAVQEHRPSDFGDRLSSSVNQGKSKDDDDDDQVNGGGGDDDPLVDSILLLKSAQLALQAEVQKFGEIGKGIRSLYDDSDKTNGVAFDSVVHMANGSMCDSCNDNGELSNSVQTLERQLTEAECSLKEKELRISELETTLKSMESTQDHVKSTIEDQYKAHIEMEGELHVLFRRKLEAEVISVVMTRSIKDSENHSLLAKEELESHRPMVGLENSDGHSSKLDTCFTGKEIQEMHRKVKKLSKCFFIQLFLLIVIVALFSFQLAPKPEVVVPT